jgi:hypothetical protein
MNVQSVALVRTTLPLDLSQLAGMTADAIRFAAQKVREAEDELMRLVAQ